jgi:acyl-CoA thioester hydrolase
VRAHEKRIEIRWRDLDAYNHVNNAVYLTYLEEARDEWLERSLGDQGSAWGYVLARVAIDFRRELTQDDDEVVASCGLARLGGSARSPASSPPKRRRCSSPWSNRPAHLAR